MIRKWLQRGFPTVYIDIFSASHHWHIYFKNVNINLKVKSDLREFIVHFDKKSKCYSLYN
jgi:hypothetical protein